jgi:hypothetical protein
VSGEDGWTGGVPRRGAGFGVASVIVDMLPDAKAGASAVALSLAVERLDWDG